jgi:hypothetical protein
MPNRLIRPGILTSPRVDALSCGAEVFYRRLMSAVDDYGRLDADWRVLRAQLFPLREGITEIQIEAWLGECAQLLPGEDDPLVQVYFVGRKRYLEISNFGQRVRAESKFPGRGGSERAQSFVRTDDSALPSSAAPASTPTPTPLSHTTPPSHTTPTEGGAGGNQFDELFERLVAEYPEGGRGEMKAARRAFENALCSEHPGREVDVFAEIFGAVIRWKMYDYRWLNGKVHGLRKFLEERMWIESPQPVANGNGRHKPPPGSKVAANLERLRKFEQKTEEEKAHAHT